MPKSARYLYFYVIYWNWNVNYESKISNFLSCVETHLLSWPILILSAFYQLLYYECYLPTVTVTWPISLHSIVDRHGLRCTFYTKTVAFLYQNRIHLIPKLCLFYNKTVFIFLPVPSSFPTKTVFIIHRNRVDFVSKPLQCE